MGTHIPQSSRMPLTGVLVLGTNPVAGCGAPAPCQVKNLGVSDSKPTDELDCRSTRFGEPTSLPA
eukprot:scaffold18816_cov32-Tisochrysis_lutea.AAC.7